MKQVLLQKLEGIYQTQLGITIKKRVVCIMAVAVCLPEMDCSLSSAVAFLDW